MLVYGLVDPTTQELRYVGKTVKTLDQRLKQHLRPSELSKHTRKACWLRSLVARAEIFVIEDGFSCHDELFVAEQFWISYFQSVGCLLTNGTDGGAGVYGYRFSEESRRKMSERRRGKAFPEFDREKWLETRWWRRPVRDDLGNEYPSAAAAARAVGVTKQNVMAALKRQGRSGGRRWTYMEVSCGG